MSKYTYVREHGGSKKWRKKETESMLRIAVVLRIDLKDEHLVTSTTLSSSLLTDATV